MKHAVINIDTLVKYQIIVNTTGEPEAVVTAVNKVLTQLLESAAEATKGSIQESRE